MDHFFQSVSVLMSALLRDTVENSLNDLVDLLELYSTGNDYPGQYDILSGHLALPNKPHPLRIFLV